MATIRRTEPSSTGELIFLHLDLADLVKVKESARRFLFQEAKLHVLFNNAGVMTRTAEPPPKTAQVDELNLGVNCIGTFLFTRLLTPLLAQTAKAEPVSSIRVTWPASFATEVYGETNVGVEVNTLDEIAKKPTTVRYGISKTGTWALGVEYAKRYSADGIVSIPLNPGNLSSGLAKDQSLSIRMVAKVIGYPPVKGAYTQLFAGLSPKGTIEQSGDWASDLALWGSEGLPGWQERVDTKLFPSTGHPLEKGARYTQSAADIRRGLLDSLEALGTKRVDTFLLDRPGRLPPFNFILERAT